MPYSADEHFQRESSSCSLKNAVAQVAISARWRLRGYGAVGHGAVRQPGRSVSPLLAMGRVPRRHGALENGVDACVSTWARVAPNTIPAAAKIAGNYLSGQLVKMEALANGYDEGIALSPGGTISEGSGQNIFLVTDGVIYTPPIDGTLLTGITRDTISIIARDAGYQVIEKHLPRESLYLADEIFLTGTASEVTPVRSVDKLKVGDGTVGPITRAIQQEYLAIAKGEKPDRHNWLTMVK